MELPPRLYRQLSFADLFLLWRDKEVPQIVHREEKKYSDVEHNSVGIFWFDEPFVFNKKKFVALLTTEPRAWRDRPRYVQKSWMKYCATRPNDIPPAEIQAMSDSEIEQKLHSLYKRLPMRKELEYHIGSRVGLGEVQVTVNRELQEKIDKLIPVINKIHSKAASPEEKDYVILILYNLAANEYGLSAVAGEQKDAAWHFVDQQVDYYCGKGFRQFLEFLAWIKTLPIADTRLLRDWYDKPATRKS